MSHRSRSSSHEPGQVPWDFAPCPGAIAWSPPTEEDLQTVQLLPASFPAAADVLSRAESWRGSLELGAYTWDVLVRAVRTPGATRVALCMHGHGPDCTSFSWLPFWPALVERGFHILTFDSPGYGRSSGTTNQTLKWKPYDQDLVLAILSGWGVPMEGGSVTVFGQCMGGAMFLRALGKQPHCFAPFHVLHNCTIGTWPPSLAGQLSAKGGGLLVFWEANEDHRRDSNVYREFSILAADSPKLCVFHELTAPEPVYPRMASSIRCQGLARDGTPGSDVPGSGSCLYILQPSNECLSACMAWICKQTRNVCLVSVPSGTAVQQGVPNKGFRVFVRVRPCLEREAAAGCSVSSSPVDGWDPPGDWEGPPPDRVTVGDRGEWMFDRVFQAESTQQDIYACIGQPLVTSVLSGRSACMFAYGQTGSGKTFTIQGTHMDGLMPLAIKEIYQQLPSHELVTVSYIQLYNDTLLDLFEPTSKKLGIQDDGNGGARVTGECVLAPQDAEELLERVALGAQFRATGETNMNDASSRSHAILTLRMGAGDAARVFHCVDLAGSERVKRSGASGERLEEAIAINSSLLALGNVVSALVENNGRPRDHIPYRDSLLTRLLRSALGGNARTAMVACISPASDSELETVSTLHFAARATYIRNKDSLDDDSGNELPPHEIEQLESTGQQPEISADGTTVISVCGCNVFCRADWTCKGPLVVFLHYYGADGGASNWTFAFDTVRGAGGRYLAPSMPGHEGTAGHSSSKPEDLGKPGGAVELLKALIDGTGERKVILVGFDWGGGVAAEFALAFPNRILKLLLWCPSVRDEEHFKPLSKRSKDICFMWTKHDPIRSYKKVQALTKALNVKYNEYDQDSLLRRLEKWLGR